MLVTVASHTSASEELDSLAGGLLLGRIQRHCIVSWSASMSVRLLLSSLASLILPDWKFCRMSGDSMSLVASVQRHGRCVLIRDWNRVPWSSPWVA